MLTQLHLKDFAVVSANAVALEAGFTVVTGETGAGKSLIVDALLCLTGARADSGMVRFGSTRAELSAAFDLADAPAAAAWLSENDYDEDGECQLRRVIRADGGSKAWINGRNATLSQLAELGALLLEIHGQHEQQHLLDRRRQLQLLDDYAQTDADAVEVSRLQRHWLDLQNQLQAMTARGDVSDQLAYLNHQLQELAQVPLDPDTIEAVSAKHKRQGQSQQLLMACNTALQWLEGDHAASAMPALQAARGQLLKWQDADPALPGIVELLDAADIQMKEAVSQLQLWQSDIDLDEGDIQSMEAQIGLWHDLARKHRVPVAELQAKAQALQAEADALNDADARLQALHIQGQEAASAWLRCAKALQDKRQQASLQLASTVSQLMAELGMAGGQFAVEWQDNSDDSPQGHGLARAEFLVSANPGQPPRPLRKVASGGELARISLAIEVATLGLDPTATMVFDEVDSGIGGAVAEVVGQKLRALGAQCQVLCVTHLAQVASLGHHHLRVAKHSDGEATESQVTALQGDARVQEVARMMGGKTLGPQSLAHAKAMLADAQS